MGCLQQRTTFRRVAVITLLLCFSGCTGYVMRGDRPKGVYHRIKKGETLWSIARAYRVNVQDIAEINNIEKPSQIETNEVLFIPEAKQVIDDAMSSILAERTPAAAGSTAGAQETGGADVTRPDGEVREDRAGSPLPGGTPSPGVSGTISRAKPGGGDAASVRPAPGEGRGPIETEASRPGASKRTEVLQFERRRFVWPVKGKVVSRFGIQRNGMFYNGIRIVAKEGAQVVASAAGTVIFSATIKDYGETVIIKHKDGYATVYTNLGARMVKTEGRVRRGDVIALLGKGDNRSGVFMNFEVRYKNKARNPLFFLP